MVSMMIMKNLMTNKVIGKHLKHELTYVVGPFGPHRGKFVCVVCNQFIKWARHDEVQTYKKIVKKGNTNKTTT